MEIEKNFDHYPQWIPLSEAAGLTPYSPEYLSLLARKKRINAKKIDGVWHTTAEDLKEYLHQQQVRHHVQHPALAGTPKPPVPTHVELQPMQSIEGAVLKKLDDLRVQFEQTSKSVDSLAKNISDKNTTPTAASQPVQQMPMLDDIATDNLIKKFDTYLDVNIESRLGIFHKIGRVVKNAFAYVAKHPKLWTIVAFSIALSVVLPIRSVFGFFDNAVSVAYNSMKDAQTVLGFRPGTHANEILLLDKKGNISIIGHIETEGQFRSFVQDGIAPIVVESKTKVENLNADYLDGTSAEEFTLAFVTKNGNVTHDDVYLEGSVEVGKTLLVKGATHLLSSLRVDGDIGVFGDALLHKSLTVDGPTYLKALLTANDVVAKNILADSLVTTGSISGKNITALGTLSGDIVSGRAVEASESVTAPTITARDLVATSTLDVQGNSNFVGQSTFRGFATFNSGLSARTGDFELGLGTSGNFVLGAAKSDGSLTTKNWYVRTNGDASFKNLVVNSCSGCGSGSGTVNSGVSGALAFYPSNGTTVDDSDTVFFDDTNNRLGVGTSSPYAPFAVVGEIVGAYFTGTTSATSTFGGPINNTATASSTFASGINISAGCFAVNGVCVSSGGTLTGSGSAGLPAVWSGAGSLTSSSTLSVNVGGTGATSLSGIVFGNGTAPLTTTSTVAVSFGGTGSTTLTGILKGAGLGSVQSAVGGTDYEFPLTFNAPLSRSTNAISISQAGSATDGYLSSTDWNVFNNKISSTSLSGTAPITYNSGTGAIGFDFSTNNTWTGANTYTGNFIVNNASSTIQNLWVTNSTTTNATTTSLAVTNLSAVSCDVKALTTGVLYCGTDATATGAADPFTFLSNYNSITAASTSPFWFQSPVYASSTLTVQGNTSLGNGTSSVLTFNAGTINHPVYSTTTIPTAVNAWSIATSTNTLTPVLSVDGSTGNVGIGTVSNGAGVPLLVRRDHNGITGIGIQNTATGIDAGATLVLANDQNANAYFFLGSSNNSSIANAVAINSDANVSNGIILMTSTSAPISFYPNSSFAGGFTATGTFLVPELVATHSTTTNATTTYLGFTNLTSCNTTSALTTNAGGAVVCGAITTSSFPFTSSLNYGVNTSATSTPIWAQSGLFASSTSHFASFDVINSTSTNATTTNAFATNLKSTYATTSGLYVTGLTSALSLFDANGQATAYTGTSCTNQLVRSLNASGAAACATVQNTDLANSTIALSDSNGTLTVGGSPASLGGTLTATLNLANNNIWTSASTTFVNGVSIANSTTTNATTTSLAVTNLSAVSCDVKALTTGVLYCGTDATATGAADPFTFLSNYNSITAASTSPFWFQSPVYASSTLTVQGNTSLGNGTSSVLTFNAGTINHPVYSTTTIPSSINAWSIATSTGTLTPALSVDSTGLNKIGIGTAQPSLVNNQNFAVDTLLNIYSVAPGKTAMINIEGNKAGPNVGISLVNHDGAANQIWSMLSNLGPSTAFLTTDDSQNSVYAPFAFLHDTGNVGINTLGLIPYSTLQVNGSSTYPQVFSVVSAASSTILQVLNSGLVGIGTTTPGSVLSVHGSALLGTTTVAGLTATGSINVLGTATSSFASGINISSGCFAIGNTCLSTSGGASTPNVIYSGGYYVASSTGTDNLAWRFNNGFVSAASSTILQLIAGNSTTTNATTTSLAVTNLSAVSCDVKALTTGVLYCGTDATATGAADPFTFLSNYNSITAASTSPFWFQSPVYASSTLTVQGNTSLGNGTSSVLTFNAGTINHPVYSTTTIPSAINAWSIATSTGVAPVFSIDTSANGNGSVGFGTAQPGTINNQLLSPNGFKILNFTSLGGALVSIEASSTSAGIGFTNHGAGNNIDQQMSALVNQGNYTTFQTVNSSLTPTSLPLGFLHDTGNVFINGGTPYSNLQITGSSTAPQTFAVVSAASSTILQVLNSGLVGVGTAQPTSRLTVQSSGNGTDPLNVTDDFGDTFLKVTQDPSSFVQVQLGDVSNVNNGTLFNLQDANKRITMTGGGTFRVGIGTTTPTAALNIVAPGSTVVPLLVTGLSTGQSADLLQIAKNPGATASLVYSASERLGIGTTSPGTTLSVAGNTLFDSNIITYGSSSAASLAFAYQKSATSTIPQTVNAWSIATSSAVYPIFSVNGSTGSVGIGTTTTGLVSGASRALTIQGFPTSGSSGVTSYPSLELVAAQSGNNQPAGRISFVNASEGTSQAEVARIESSVNGFANQSDLLVYTAQNGSSISEKARVTAAGRFGLGTTSPASLLSVHGSALLGTTTVAGLTATGSINVLGTATSSFASGINISSGCFAVGNTCVGGSSLIGSGSSGQATFWAGSGSLSGSNNFFWDNTNGKLGIGGTTTPGATFSLKGDALFDSNTITYGSTSAASLTLAYQRPSTSTIPASINAWSIATSTGAAPILSVDGSTGSIGVGTANPFLVNSINFPVDKLLNIVSTGAGKTTMINIEGDKAGPSVGLSLVNRDATANHRWSTLSNLGGSTGFLVLDDAGNLTYAPIAFTHDTGNVNIGGLVSPYSNLQVNGSSTAPQTFAVVSSASSTILQVLNSGQVGIGTTSPATTLSVAGNTLLDSNAITYGSTSAANLTFAYQRSSTSTIPQAVSAWSIATSTAVGNLPILSVNGNGFGNIAIGTTTTGVVSGASRYLDIAAGTREGNTNAFPSIELLAAQSTANNPAGRITFFNSEGSSFTTGSEVSRIESLVTSFSDQADLLFYTKQDGVALSEKARLTAIGRFGLGTTSPSSLLSVHGSALLGTTTVAGLTATGSINVLGTATSSFASGINISSGCFAIGNTCLSTSGGASTPNVIYSGGYYVASSTGTDNLAWRFNNGFVSAASSTILQLIAGNSTTTNATTTSLAVTNLSAVSCDVKALTTGVLYCGTDATATGAADPFTFTTNYGGIVAATSSSMWFQNPVYASSTLTVQGNTSLGNGTSSVLTFNAGTINHPVYSTTTIPSAINAWSIATSTGVAPVFSIDTSANGNGSIGFGTAQPGTINGNPQTDARILNLKSDSAILNIEGSTTVVASFVNTNGLADHKWSILLNTGDASFFGLLNDIGNANYVPITMFHDTGNVGISSAGPAASTLQVNGSSTKPQLFGVIDSASSTILQVLENGNVGIGTANPQYPLDIQRSQNAATYVSVQNSSTGNAAIAEYRAWNNLGSSVSTGITSSNWTVAGNLNDIGYLSTDARSLGIFNTTSNSDIRFYLGGLATSSMKAILNTTGFGIGTTSPATTLSVAGDTLLDSNIITYGSTSAANLTFAYQRSSTSTIPSAINAWSIATSSSANPLISIDSVKGSVGIGTAKPNFIVNGTLAGQGKVLNVNGNGTTTSVSVEGSSAILILTDNDAPTDQKILEIANTTGQTLFLTAKDSGDYLAAPLNIRHSNGNVTINGLGYAYSNLQVNGSSTAPQTFAVVSAASTTLLQVLNSGEVGIGTTSPTEQLSVANRLFVGGTGTSTFQNNLHVNGTLQVGTGSLYLGDTFINASNGGLGLSSISTSTFANGIQAPALNITNASASSTFSNGINLSAGCFAVANTCIGSGGSGTVTSGTTGQFPYYAANGTTLTATSSLFVATSGNVGVGTTSPSAKLSIHANATDPTQPLFTIGSSSPSSTSTLFTVLNNGKTGIGTTDFTDPIIGTSKLKVVEGNMQMSFADNVLFPGQGWLTVSNGTITGYVGHTNNTDGYTMGSYTNHKVTLRTNNTNRMVIDTTGNVGIGTTTPGATLSVAGNTLLDSNLITYGSSSAANLTFAYQKSATSTVPQTVNAWSIATSSSVYPIFSVNGSTGSVGIGTTTTGLVSGASRALTIQGVPTSGSFTAYPALELVAAQGGNNQPAGRISFVNSSEGTTQNEVARIESSINGFSSQSDLLFYTTQNGSSISEKARVTAAGRFGVGTTSPGARLSVAGNTLLDSNVITYGSSSAVSLTFTHQTSATSTIPSAINAWSIGTTTAVGNAPILSVDSSNGFVGIGTAAPARGLTIDNGSSGSQSSLRVRWNAEVGNSVYFYNHGVLMYPSTASNDIGYAYTFAESGGVLLRQIMASSTLLADQQTSTKQAGYRLDVYDGGTGSIYSRGDITVPTGKVDTAKLIAGNSTTTNATTTSLAILNLTSASCDVKALTTGVIYCGTDATSANGAADPFSFTTNFNSIVAATSSPVWFRSPIYASSTLTVAGNTLLDAPLLTLASSSARTLTIAYGTTSTSTIPIGFNAWSLATSTSALDPIMSIDSRSGSIGFGTSSPLFIDGFDYAPVIPGAKYLHIFSRAQSGLVVEGNAAQVTLQDVDALDASQTFSMTNSNAYTTFSSSNGFTTLHNFLTFSHATGTIGIASTTPWAHLSVEKNIAGIPTFAVSDNGSSTPWFIVNENGYVGVGTSSPATPFAVAGNTYFNSNRLTFASSSATSLIFDLQAKSTTTIPSAINAWGIATSTNTATPYISIDSSSATNVNIGIGNMDPTLVDTSTNYSGLVGNIFNIKNKRDNGTVFTSGQVLAVEASSTSMLVLTSRNANALYGNGEFYIQNQCNGRCVTPVTNFVVASGGTTNYVPLRIDNNSGRVAITNTSNLVSPYSTLQITGAGASTGQIFGIVNSASTTLLQVLDNGKVGIGTTSPGALLAVAGDSLTSGTSTVYGLIVNNPGDAEQPLKDTSIGSPTNVASDFNMGYKFTPKVNGYITQLGANCAAATRVVRIYDFTSTTELASSTVTTTGVGTWVYGATTINGTTRSLYVTAGTSYVVSERASTNTWCNIAFTTPRSNNNVTIEDSRYIAASNSMPNTTTNTIMYGLADFTFVPDFTPLRVTNGKIVVENMKGCNALGAKSSTGIVSCESYATSTSVSDTRWNNSIVSQGVPELQFPINSNETWNVIFMLNTDFGSAADVLFRVTAPTDASCNFVGSNDVTGDAERLSTCNSNSALLNMSAFGTQDHVIISGQVKSATLSGTVQLYLRQNAATNDGTIVYPGSTMVAYKQNTAVGADLAEIYVTDGVLSHGTIVTSDSQLSPIGVKKASYETPTPILGVITSQPGVVMGSTETLSGSTTPAMVALAGRIPVRVNLENGPINPGDRISLSLIPGVGKKARAGEDTVGIALEGFSGTTTPDGVEETGSVLTFLTLQHSEFASNFDAISQSFASSSASSTELVASSSPSSITIMAQRFAEAVTSFFKSVGIEIAQGFLKVKDLVATTLFVDKATIADLDVQKVNVSDQIKVGSSAKPIGITIYDQATGDPLCIFSSNGSLTSQPGECSATASPSGSSGSAMGLTLPDSGSSTGDTSAASTPSDSTASTTTTDSTPASSDTSATTTPSASDTTTATISDPAATPSDTTTTTTTTDASTVTGDATTPPPDTSTTPPPADTTTPAPTDTTTTP